ncbi:ATP-binding cassette domain-containing protein [Leifsonia xyli]|uniref:ATP-binding cassette domain-containing protein n=1 Tax=Leifsonia xyli TaxID=1575 RepID=UPI003D67E0F1
MTPDASSGIVLELRDVTFRRSGTHILDGIDLTVRAGEHWALLGPNGAGKSTLLRFCGALSFPTSGTVDVLGGRLGRVELQELRRHIGHVDPRHPVRSPLTVTEVVLTGVTGTLEPPMRWEATEAERGRARDLIHSVGLDERRDARWPTLSQGSADGR